MKNLAFILLAMTSLLCSAAHSWDSDRLRQHITIELWPDGAPTDNGVDYAHLSVENNRDIKPQMHVFLPDGEQPHRSVIICPGGAYGGLAMYHEGFEWVDFFVSQDIAAIVLLYRLPHGHHSVPSEDVYEAIRQAQAHAGEWHLSPSKIGIMGSSAGGHLASTIATHAPSSLRPSFQILLYPVISTDSAFTHHWSCRNLMGEHPSAELVRHYSNEHQVDASTPPAFIAASADDGDVPVLNSARYYEALVSHGVSANIHVYPSGGHGWGIKSSFKYHSQLLQSLRDWLESTKKSSHDH